MISINQKNCDTSVENLGVPECIVQNGRITGMLAVDPAWSVDITSGTLDAATVNELIQDGTFIPILGAVEVVNGTPEAVTEEYQGGVMSVVRNGLPMFTFKFLKGWAFARALYSMNSFQAYKILLVFEDGSISGVVDGVTFSGYTLGMLNTGTFMHTDGATSGYVNTIIQLTSADEYNRYTAVIDRSVLGFDANALFPITDILITGRADVSENKVYFKPTFKQNQAQTLQGLAIANLRFTINGVVDTITALSLTYEPTTKEWAFTPTTPLVLLQSLVVQLYDATAVVATAKVGNKFYKGTSDAFLPTA